MPIQKIGERWIGRLDKANFIESSRRVGLCGRNRRERKQLDKGHDLARCDGRFATIDLSSGGRCSVSEGFSPNIAR